MIHIKWRYNKIAFENDRKRTKEKTKNKNNNENKKEEM